MTFKEFFKTMPVTAAVFTVGALAVIGVPPTCGFFSKWYLLLGGIQAHQWGFVVSLLICTLINIALFFKIFDRGLFIRVQEDNTRYLSSHDSQSEHVPALMLLPSVLVAFVILLIGIFNQFIINDVLSFKVF